MKKLFSNLSLVIITSLTIVLVCNACAKGYITKKGVTTKHTIDGLWVGTYLNNNLESVPKQYMSISIYPNGEMLTNAFGGDIRFIAKGSWVLNGNNFSANVSNIWSSMGYYSQSYSYTAVYDSICGNLTKGTWQDINTSISSGTFSVKEIH